MWSARVTACLGDRASDHGGYWHAGALCRGCEFEPGEYYLLSDEGERVELGDGGWVGPIDEVCPRASALRFADGMKTHVFPSCAAAH